MRPSPCSLACGRAAILLACLLAGPASAEPAAEASAEPAGPCAVTGQVRTPGGEAPPLGTRIWSERRPGLSLAVDADGRFRTELKCGVRRKVLVSAPGHEPSGPQELGTEAPAVLATGPADPGAALVGEVVDVMGRPLPGVEVLGTCHGSAIRLATTDAKGRYRVTKLPTSCVLVFAAAGLPRRGVSLRAIGSSGSGAGPRGRGAVAPGALHLATVVLARGYRVRGCVTLDGAPVAGVEVNGLPSSSPRRPDERPGSPVTGPDGCFEAWPVGEGEHPIMLWALDDLHRSSVRVEGRDPPPLHIELQRQTRIEVEVVSSAGGPLSGGEVICYRDGSGRTRTLDAEGRAVFQLFPGAFKVRARAAGHAEDDTTFTAAPGEVKKVRLVLHAAEPLRVRVLTATGAPAPAGTTVYAHPGSVHLMADCDATGTAVLTTLAPGDYVISAQGVPGAVDVTVPSEDDHVILDARARHVAGRLVSRSGRPVAGLLVCRAEDYAKGCTVGVRTDAEGRFRFEDLPPGSHHFVADAPAPVSLVPGETGRTRMVLELP